MTTPRPLSDQSATLVKTGQNYYVPNYRPREMIIDRGKGARVWDLDGNEYIDLGAGIAVTGLGHADPDLIAALTTQAGKIWHTSNIFFTEPAVKLAEELCTATGMRRVFFCNSGGEANEAAIKLARKYSSAKYPPTKRDIVTFHGSFHGRTLATVTATAQPKYQEGFEPLPGGFRYCKFNDEAAATEAINENTCAVLVEPIQGEGGITSTKPGFLKHLRALCDKVDALLMIDEIQTGMGRTGKLLAHEHETGANPDVVTLAKGIAGGFPLGAMLVGEKAHETFQFGAHGSTFGGNPMGCAVARTVLKKLQSQALQQNVTRQSDRLRKALQTINEELKIFSEVRGRGLMIGAELVSDLHGKAGELSETARKHGVLALIAGPNVMRLLPPLTITDEELEEGIKRLHQAVRDWRKG